MYLDYIILLIFLLFLANEVEAISNQEIFQIEVDHNYESMIENLEKNSVNQQNQFNKNSTPQATPSKSVEKGKRGNVMSKCFKYLPS